VGESRSLRPMIAQGCECLQTDEQIGRPGGRGR